MKSRALRAALPVVVLCTLAAAGGEQRLTGDFAADLRFGEGSEVRIVYSANIRPLARLGLSAGSRLTLSGGSEAPAQGRCELVVDGFLDLFGSGKKPVEVQGLNAARITLGKAEGRDDLRKKSSMMRAQARCTVFRNVSIIIHNGAADFEECVFINSPVIADGGQVAFKLSTFYNPQGTALEILRSDTYPAVSLYDLEITGSRLALSIRKNTVRKERLPLLIVDCAFRGNTADIYYEETMHLPVRGCWFDGLVGKELEGRFQFPENPERPGRIMAQAVRKTPPTRSGAKLLSDGVVTLPAPEQPAAGAAPEAPAEPQAAQPADGAQAR